MSMNEIEGNFEVLMFTSNCRGRMSGNEIMFFANTHWEHAFQDPF